MGQTIAPLAAHNTRRSVPEVPFVGTAAATRDLADAEIERRTEERVRAATAEWRCTSTPINTSPRTWDIDLRNVGPGDAELLSVEPGFARDDLDAPNDEQWALRGAPLPRRVRAGESVYVYLRAHHGRIITSLTMAVRGSDGREGPHVRVLPVDEGDLRR